MNEWQGELDIIQAKTWLDSNKLLQHESYCSGPTPEDTGQVL